MSVTFVTAFVCTSTRTPDDYVRYFEQLASTGIDILLFLDERLRDEGASLCARYPNVRIPEMITMPPIPDDVILPEHRTVAKDTAEYLTVQCSKLAWMRKALAYTSRPYLAWIDFRIFHIFRSPDQAGQRLREIEQCPPETDRILAPGCWGPGSYAIWSSIVWRFCGGFLLGPRDQFPRAYERQTAILDANRPRLTWEVNLWTQMEDLLSWYPGNHDDTILPPENRHARSQSEST